ncbi:2-oxo acid dehydrogenase subunit E2 [Brevundimonas subvibrioides]|uniref:Dihydrolipoamide acetyltransferase component of pyruvate dehydrogenase complex n=1 Tax=Brevundimonas subvibrioides (strain ATCC 15264 / DSM 4735 / LMG 14903 / NBRC 16000 / CB 81) TaxID=633149 RepID=D9QG93_BRESC|nr:2-oxo acid dehydrogenase subunit E2 [Brevundimonas subvibrioides]ADL02635.1 catalytic domain of components of various dehydrogenase complexes [Brevundimonas subvibrioides ATCC 15264]
MGRYVFKLPDVGEGTAEAELVGWHVKVGDRVEEDQILADIMTDKATVELTSPVSGVVTALHGEPGVMSPVGSALVEFEVEGAGNSESVAQNPSVIAQAGDAHREDRIRSSDTPSLRDGEETDASASPPHVSGEGDREAVEGLSAAAPAQTGNYVFKLPDVGEGTAEAELVTWHVAVGDAVEEDQLLAEVMTDKATVELTSPVAGTVAALHGAAGQQVPVGGPLVSFDVEGAGNVVAPAPVLAAPKATGNSVTAPATISKTPTKTSTTLETGSAKTPASAPVARTAQTPGVRPLASPAVRKRARELGLELQFVPGSGPAGRIEHGDLDAFVTHGARGPSEHGASPTSTYARAEGTTETRIIGLRRKIAEKMAESVRRIPHITYVEEIDVTALEDLRAHLNAQGKSSGKPKLNLLPFIARAIVVALRDQPAINSHYDDEAGVLTTHAAVHLGIAAQTPNGLMVPVVRHAEARDPYDTALEIARVSGAAKDGSAKREELSGSTITITSLGTLGGVVHTPIINHPEVAIIGPNKIEERVVVRNGQMVVRKMMNLSSSFDHRIVDGHDAAVFVQRIKGLLEHPATLWMG